ncbi:TPA: phosphoadenosine phosphosulfate reductase family protein [Cronobacter sakazakii]|nr:phosphoadenosine phosphosulfate reductase family protein [Cronobacter sakazakii]
MSIPQVVSFSGGRTSAYLVHLMEQRRAAGEDVHYVFMDTGAEHPKTYEFVRNVVRHWGIDLHCLRVIPDPEMGKPSTYEELSVDEIGPDLIPWKRMLNKYGHPYVGGAFCTDRMKSVPFTKYCQERFGEGKYHTWLGIRIDEQSRLKEAKGFSYLADISDFEKQDVIDWWAEQSFDLGIQEHLGNCVFCIKKSMQKVALAVMDEPQLAGQFINILDTEIRTGREPVMYRGNNTLKSLIALFSDTSRDELASRMTSMRQYDTGSCSESCEAFSCQLGFNFEEAA